MAAGIFEEQRAGYTAILFVVGSFFVAAVARTGNPVFFLFDDRPTTFFILVCFTPILLWYALISVKLMLAGRPEPIRRLSRYTRLNKAWLLRALALIAVMAMWSSGFTIFKMSIPKMVPFYADPALVELDRTLLGTDAWRLTHAVIGPAGTVVLDRAYTVWFAVLAGFLAWTIGSRNAAFQVQSLLSYILIWVVLGCAMATGLSSVGPCFLDRFYGLTQFEPLMERLRGNPQPLLALRAMDYLEAMYGKTAYANGISAMPSMHVAVAAWFVLVARAGSRSVIPMAVAMVYAAVMLIGSVHLGWHYLADGLISLIVAPAIWYATERLLAACNRPRPDRAPNAAQCLG